MDLTSIHFRKRITTHKTTYYVCTSTDTSKLNIFLNLLFINLVGREGAAMASLVAYLSLSFGSLMMVQIVNPIPNFNLKKYLAAISVIFLFSFSVFLKDFFPHETIFYSIMLPTFSIIYFQFFKKELSSIWNFIKRGDDLPVKD